MHGYEQEVTLGARSVLLYPLYHPAAALYTPSMLKVLEEDFARIPALLERAVDEPSGAERARRSRARARPRVSPARPVLTCTIELASASAGETERIAAALAERLAIGDVVTVSGELGAGKTTFVRGACRALGVTSPVTSPTFTIGHRYVGAVDVSHLDLYRFTEVSAAEWGDLEPYFDDAVVFVEWPEAGASALPPARVAVSLEHAGDDRRRIVLASAETALLDMRW